MVTEIEFDGLRKRQNSNDDEPVPTEDQGERAFDKAKKENKDSKQTSGSPRPTAEAGDSPEEQKI